MKKLSFCLLMLMLITPFSQHVSANDIPIQSGTNQQKQVTGKVVDDRGEEIIGANVVVKGSAVGTITGLDGDFTLNVPSENSVLVISYIGFTPQEVSVAGQSNLHIVLRSNTELLDEVVVVGYGTQKKVNLTGAVQSVSNEQMLKRNVSSAATALQGLVPGVSVVQTSGQPGNDAASIKIRGVGSINSSTGPLVLIDGVEGDMATIDMNSISSISVLKDAASASIYGSRASNGVILITTKRASEDGVKVSYNGYVGFTRATELPEPVDAVGYMEAINIARANADTDPLYSQDLINLYKTQGADNITRYDTDWKDLIMKDAALMHNHSVSLSGGAAKTNYFANAAYYYQDGLIPNNDFNRFTLRVNTDTQITNWLKASVDVFSRRSETVRPPTDPKSVINWALTYTPVLGGINSDGTWANGQNEINPAALAEAGGTHKTINNELNLKGALYINPLEGLNGMVSYSSRRVTDNVDQFIKSYDTYENGNYILTYPPTGTQRYAYFREYIKNQFNAQVSYEKSIEKNYFNVLVGMQTEEIKDKNFSATRTGYEFDGYEELNQGNISSASNTGTQQSWAMMSYFARINYNYAEKYLLELNGRWDGSSRFMRDHRWGFFPSVSAGWRISEENFFEPVKDVVNNLKIRASYGTLGNENIIINNTAIYFPYGSLITQGNTYGYWFDKGLSNGMAQTQVSNPYVTWEKSSQTNIGLDASLFNSRLNTTFDYYIRDIKDLLQQFPIPGFVGLSAAWSNGGSMRNKGWDLSLSWNDQIGKVKYGITGNLSDVRNEVTSLNGNSDYIETSWITTEGAPFKSWYGYVSDGFFQSQQEIDEATAVYGGDKANVKPGYIRYKDISGPDGVPDGVIDDYDRTIIGDPNPRYEFSLNLTAEWNNFDFSMFFQGIGKRDLYLSSYGARPFVVGRTIYKHQLDAWSETNRDAEFPLLLIDGGGNLSNNIASDFWVKSGAFMRLKNVVVGYTLPRKLTQKIKLDYLRFYVNGQNLFTVKNAYKGYDPELDVNEGSFYPLMQTFTFGVDVRF